ncbi:MAG TPA: DNA-processing protein DprA [Candidatus Paceibacterota bacterium]|nr:DNA-processing protein DprA [Candidatus Paceibacterota bacterium]
MDLRTITKEDFPFGLSEIPQPPARLWLKGTLPPAGTKILAVVGSRALTRYGREACEYLISGLAGYPISIVSGLALGADACAHRAALAAGLHTIAIPGSGLGDAVLYPRTNRELAKKIVDAGGALLSEHPPEYAAHPYDFPSRNRIMVGVSQAVLMIEAGEKSGTLITAGLTGEYGRDLLCVPHPIRGVHSAGSHQFLRIGAAHVSEPKHILEALGIALPETPEETAQHVLPLLSGTERLIYGLLEEPSSRDELLRRASVPAHEALSALSALELKGFVHETFGAWQRI